MGNLCFYELNDTVIYVKKKLFIPIFYDNNHTGQNAKFQSKEVFDSNTQQYYMRKKNHGPVFNSCPSKRTILREKKCNLLKMLQKHSKKFDTDKSLSLLKYFMRKKKSSQGHPIPALCPSPGKKIT